jgi:hypothetical protein
MTRIFHVRNKHCLSSSLATYKDLKRIDQIVRPRRARTKIGFSASHEFGLEVLAIGAADLPHGAVYLVFEDIDRM